MNSNSNNNSINNNILMILQPGGLSLSVGDVVGTANWGDKHATAYRGEVSSVHHQILKFGRASAGKRY